VDVDVEVVAEAEAEVLVGVEYTVLLGSMEKV
jgi:hypothetical protein